VFGFQDPDILTTQSNEILTAIVHGMKKEEPRFVNQFTAKQNIRGNRCLLEFILCYIPLYIFPN